MKVCHVITRMIIGGAQENTLFSIRGLLDAGHQVELVTGPSPGPEGELLKNMSADYDRLRVVECPDLVRSISPWQDWKAYRFLLKYFRNNQFDVVHTHSSKAGIVGRLAAWSAGVPLVVHTVHGLAFHRFEKAWKNQIYIFLEKIAAKKCHKIYAVAQAMIDQCLAAGIGKKEQYQVVYSGMELEPFLESVRDEELRRSLKIPASAKVLGTVARLFPLKGYEELFKVIPDLVSEYPDLHFLFVGDGSLRQTLEARAETGGFRHRISFAGLIPPSQVYRYVAQMDILVHFSLREGLPRAVVQGLASGKPAIAYNLDGTPEVVLPGKTGILVEPGDTAAIKVGLNTLLTREAERKQMGMNGRELVKSRFGWKLMADTLMQDYEQELAEKQKK